MSHKTALLFTLTFTGVVNPLGEGNEDDPTAEPMTVSELYRNLNYAVEQVILGNGLVTGDSYGTVESHDHTVTVTKGYPWQPDAGLTAEQLDDKYNPKGYGEHPNFPRADWRAMVSEDATLRGYWEWVANMIETHDPDNDV